MGAICEHGAALAQVLRARSKLVELVGQRGHVAVAARHAVAFAKPMATAGFARTFVVALLYVDVWL
eukprot:7641383-Pyramimonas_sp.AAC.1